MLRAVQGFLQSPRPPKALVLSFHGWSGTGKNFVARMVATHLYRDGLRSDCVRVFVSLLHFPHHNYVDSYKVRAKATAWSHGLGWAGVHVLPSSPCGAVPWVCEGNWVQQHWLVTAEQRLHSLRLPPSPTRPLS